MSDERSPEELKEAQPSAQARFSGRMSQETSETINPFQYKRRAEDRVHDEVCRLRWDVCAMFELDQAKIDFSRSMRTESERSARDKGASIVTDGDVLRARNTLSTKKPVPKIVILGHMVGVIGIFYGGTVSSLGWANDNTTTIMTGLVITILATAIDAVVQYYNR